MKTTVLALAVAIFSFALSSSAQDPVYTPPRGTMLNKKKKQEEAQSESSDDSSAPRPTGNPLLDKIESKLGHSLSTDQRVQFEKAAQKASSQRQRAHAEYVNAISKASGISKEDVRKLHLRAGDSDAISKIEAKSGQALTPDQKDAITTAGEEAKSQNDPARENFAKEVARISDLSEDDVKSMMSRD